MGNPDGFAICLFGENMGKSISYLFYLKNLYIWKKEKALAQLLPYNKSIYSDIEAFACFYANKVKYKFIRMHLQRNGKVFGMTLVITGLLVLYS